MYLNTFISLDENISGYGMGYKKPSGHITISNPGIIKCYIQNLKAMEGKEYIAYAIGKGKKAVRLGAIKDPERTKQTVWDIDINNVKGQNVGAKDIDCIAIVVEGDTIGATDTILIGYSKEKYLITPLMEAALPKKTQMETASVKVKDTQPLENKPSSVAKQKENSVKEEIEKVVQESEVKVVEEIVQEPEVKVVKEIEKVVQEPEVKVVKEIEKVVQEPEVKVIEEVQEAMKVERVEEVEEHKIIDGTRLAQILKEVIQEDKEPSLMHQEIQNTLATFMEVQKQVEEVPQEGAPVKKSLIQQGPREEARAREMVDEWSRVREIFESSTPIEPFVDADDDIDWVMMSNSELASIPQFTYEWVTQPFVSYCYQKFNHLILGRQKGLEQYYVGIPDIYYPNRRYILEYDKIESFRCAEDKVPCTGDFGYWIARV